MKNERTNAGETVGEYWSGRGSLVDLVTELERQKESRLDFVADCRSLSAIATEEGTEDGSAPRMRIFPSKDGTQVREFIGGDGVELGDSAFAQLCERSEPSIPVRYGRKLLAVNPFAAGTLAEETFCQSGSRRLFRCLDGRVRAVLSDQYRIVDNYDLAFSALEAVHAADGEVIEAALSEKSMKLKFTTKSIFDTLETTRSSGPSGGWYSGGLGSQDYLGKVGANTRGDLPGGPGTIHPIVTLSNSETGHGGIRVRLGILQAVCFNIATVETVVSEIHLGGRLDGGIFSEETRSTDSKAIFLKSRDAIRAAFDPKKFAAMVARIRKSTETPIEAPSTAVGIIAERLDLDEEKRTDLLEHFLGTYARTAFGLASALTRVAQDVADPERAEEFENFGGELMTKPELVAAA